MGPAVEQESHDSHADALGGAGVGKEVAKVAANASDAEPSAETTTPDDATPPEDPLDSCPIESRSPHGSAQAEADSAGLRGAADSFRRSTRVREPETSPFDAFGGGRHMRVVGSTQRGECLFIGVGDATTGGTGVERILRGSFSTLDGHCLKLTEGYRSARRAVLFRGELTGGDGAAEHQVNGVTVPAAAWLGEGRSLSLALARSLSLARSLTRSLAQPEPQP